MNALISRFAGTICLAIVITILIAGLWPFNFFPENKVAWLAERDGVRFHGQGIITGPELDVKKQKSFLQSKAITVEIWLRPDTETASLPHILTLCDREKPDVFLVGQWKSHLAVRSRVDDPVARKRGKPYQEIGFHNALLKNQDAFVTITSGVEGSTIYLNGQPVRTHPRHRMLGSVISGNARLVLGNSPAGDNYWTGNVMGLAVYSRVLTQDEVVMDFQSWLQNDSFAIKKNDGLVSLYTFYEKKGEMTRNLVNPDEILSIPNTFEPVKRKTLEPPGLEFSLNLPSLQDIAVNILGFVPVGFFFSAFLLGKARKGKLGAYVIAALLGVGLSLFIELTQAWLPARDSSLVDLICNTGGTILGIFIFQVFKWRCGCSNRE